jgi:hypothetical protein
MVPFIDVMLVLLIIFMVTATDHAERDQPAEVDRASKQPDKPIEIVIKSDDGADPRRTVDRRPAVDPHGAIGTAEDARAATSAHWSSAPTSRSSMKRWSRR